MSTFNKKFIFLYLLACFVQSSLAIEHEYSEKHFTSCELSTCIQSALLDDLIEPEVSVYLKLTFTYKTINPGHPHQIILQDTPLFKPARAPPLL